MNYWLFKSEPHVFSFADLKSRRREPWSGVRNYQARNYMRDGMKVGDAALFYHSSCPEPGIAGVMTIASEPIAYPTQFNPKDEYFDSKATPEKPIWQLVEVEWVANFVEFVPLENLRSDAALTDMLILRKGNRLSITPVTAAEFRRACKLGGINWKQH